MILVLFRGYGEWFIRDSNCIKLAVTRTTKDPYRDPRQHKRIETYCPDYDEWLGLDEDNEENFTEWARLYESTRDTGNTPLDDFYDFDSKDYKYDSKLGGIFVRDPNVEGDVFNTDGLRSFGADYVRCDEIQDIFKLNAKDEEVYQLTKNWDEVKKRVKTLLPCSHTKSACIKKVDEEKLSSNNAEQFYFEIQYKQYIDYFGKAKPIENKPPLLQIIDIDEPASEKITANTVITTKSETILNKTALKKRNVMQRYNEALALLHAALDEIEGSTHQTPKPEELVKYVLGGTFEHPNIQKRSPDENTSVTRRKLYLTNGKTLDADQIKVIYRETIFRKKTK